MKPSLTILEIRYKEPASQFLFLNSVVKSISDTSTQSNLLVGGTFETRLKEERTLVLIEPQRIALSVEARKTEQELSVLLDDILQKAFDGLSFSSVTRIGIRTVWIKKMRERLKTW